MRNAIALLFLLAAAAAAQSLTTVSDMIRDGTGKGVTGTCSFQAATGRFLGAAQDQIVGEPVDIAFTNGVFFARLIPTDSGLPTGQYYSVHCSGNRGWKQSGAWMVPASGGILKLKDIWAAIPPPPGMQILLTQIPPAGLGAWCLQSIDGVIMWVSGTCGTGGGTLTLSGLTNSQLLSMTNSQLSTLAN